MPQTLVLMATRWKLPALIPQIPRAHLRCNSHPFFHYSDEEMCESGSHWQWLTTYHTQHIHTNCPPEERIPPAGPRLAANTHKSDFEALMEMKQPLSFATDRIKTKQPPLFEMTDGGKTKQPPLFETTDGGETKQPPSFVGDGVET